MPTIDECTKAIQLNQSDATAYRSRGIARLQKGEIEHAIDDLTVAMQLTPDLSAAFSSDEWEWAEKVGLTPAIESYLDATPFTTSDVIHQQRRAQAWALIRRPDRSVEHYDEAIKFATETSCFLHHCRGLQLAAMNWPDHAIEDMNIVIDREPTTLLHVQKGQMWTLRDRTDFETIQRAIDDFTEALRCDPTFSLAYLEGIKGDILLLSDEQIPPFVLADVTTTQVA